MTEETPGFDKNEPEVPADAQSDEAAAQGAGPAEQAGLAKGDVIIEIAGQSITNIYDYTYALDAVKIGRPVQITIERDGKRVTITATPEARK